MYIFQLVIINDNYFNALKLTLLINSYNDNGRSLKVYVNNKLRFSRLETFKQ